MTQLKNSLPNLCLYQQMEDFIYLTDFGAKLGKYTDIQIISNNQLNIEDINKHTTTLQFGYDRELIEQVFGDAQIKLLVDNKCWFITQRGRDDAAFFARHLTDTPPVVIMIVNLDGVVKNTALNSKAIELLSKSECVPEIVRPFLDILNKKELRASCLRGTNIHMQVNGIGENSLTYTIEGYSKVHNNFLSAYERTRLAPRLQYVVHCKDSILMSDKCDIPMLEINGGKCYIPVNSRKRMMRELVEERMESITQSLENGEV